MSSVTHSHVIFPFNFEQWALWLRTTDLEWWKHVVLVLMDCCLWLDRQILVKYRLKNVTVSSCDLPTNAPEGQSESPVAHPNHFCFVLHLLHHEEAAFWTASSLVCSCSACVKHIPTDPSFSVHVKENRCFTKCKSMRLFQSRAASSERRPFSYSYPHTAKQIHKSWS